jgi:hypothetical protein
MRVLPNVTVAEPLPPEISGGANFPTKISSAARNLPIPRTPPLATAQVGSNLKALFVLGCTISFPWLSIVFSNLYVFVCAS